MELFLCMQMRSFSSQNIVQQIKWFPRKGKKLKKLLRRFIISCLKIERQLNITVEKGTQLIFFISP